MLLRSQQSVPHASVVDQTCKTAPSAVSGLLHNFGRRAAATPFKSSSSFRRKFPVAGSQVSPQAHSGAGSPSVAAHIVLTREKGKNGKLAAALQQKGLHAVELPLVETAPGPDRNLLVSHLHGNQYDWIVITSPEAANVFLRAWEGAEKPQIRIAVVGQGTGNVLCARQEAGLAIEYTPEVANAVHLSAGLPHIEGGTQKVLYPSSAKAGSDLQTGLQRRGFEVVRLNTYDTRPVQQVDVDKLQQACQAAVITFASPSAVKAWRKLTAGQKVGDMAIACIGSTTAIAAEKQGFQNVYYPEQPGIDGFVSAVTDALQFQQTQADSVHV